MVVKYHGKNKIDMTFFRNITAESNVIMGKNTYLSIGSPLKNRINIIVSTTIEKNDNYHVVSSLEDGLNLASKLDSQKNIFVIGGSKLYCEALIHPKLRYIYLNIIDNQANCDTFFPNLPLKLKMISYSATHDVEFLKFQTVG